jgi:hypothetical protein
VLSIIPPTPLRETTSTTMVRVAPVGHLARPGADAELVVVGARQGMDPAAAVAT